MIIILLILNFHILTPSAVELKELLFPKSTEILQIIGSEIDHRVLTKRKQANPAQCVKCHDLKYCSVINGYMIEEVYISKAYSSAAEIAAKGTCTVFEALGERMNNELFGVGKTFRDNSQCRSMVLQYLCLFWSSDNSMYTNSCINFEDVSSPDPTQHLLAPRPPCRSFCVQVSVSYTNIKLLLCITY